MIVCNVFIDWEIICAKNTPNKTQNYVKRILSKRSHTKKKYAHTHKWEKYTQTDIHTKRVCSNFGRDELFNISN